MIFQKILSHFFASFLLIGILSQPAIMASEEVSMVTQAQAPTSSFAQFRSGLLNYVKIPYRNVKFLYQYGKKKYYNEPISEKESKKAQIIMKRAGITGAILLFFLMSTYVYSKTPIIRGFDKDKGEEGIIATFKRIVPDAVITVEPNMFGGSRRTLEWEVVIKRTSDKPIINPYRLYSDMSFAHGNLTRLKVFDKDGKLVGDYDRRQIDPTKWWKLQSGTAPHERRWFR